MALIVPSTIKHMMSDIDAGFLRDVVLLLQYFCTLYPRDKSHTNGY